MKTMRRIIIATTVFFKRVSDKIHSYTQTAKIKKTIAEYINSKNVPTMTMQELEEFCDGDDPIEPTAIYIYDEVKKEPLVIVD